MATLAKGCSLAPVGFALVYNPFGVFLLGSNSELF